MATETTQLPGQLSQDVRRGLYMAALSIAEQIMSESPVVPTSFQLQVPNWPCAETEITFYFHRDPDSLRQFAEERFMTVSTEERGGGSLYTEARGRSGDVAVVAWSLTSAETAAVAA